MYRVLATSNHDLETFNEYFVGPPMEEYQAREVVKIFNANCDNYSEVYYHAVPEWHTPRRFEP